MPTGYTMGLYKGKELTFEEFVMQCARAFGALIIMRDEPLDTPIPEKFSPSDYHLKELEKARERLTKIESWGKERAEKEAKKAYQEAVRKRNEIITRHTQLRQRYEKMLAQVEAWIVPTPDHRELKQFMIDQLDQLKKSIKFDCGYTPDEPQRLTGSEYKEEQLAKVRQDIAYHTKEHEQEVKRTEERNKWMQALRESLRC